MQPASIRRVTARETGTTFLTLFLAWLRARALVLGASGFAFVAFGDAVGDFLGADFFGADLAAALVVAFGAAFVFFAVDFAGDFLGLLAAAFEAIQTHRHLLGNP